MRKAHILAFSILAAILLVSYVAFLLANQGEEEEWVNPFPTNPGVATYKADGTQSDIFNVGEQVNITAYSASTPYNIEVTLDGTPTYTDTSNTRRYSKLITGITTTLGEYQVTAGSSSTHYAVAWYTVIPETPLGVAAVLTACLAGLGIHRIRKK